ncbi:MAG: hypothetical protein KBC62_00040 [Candidatus Pacebacteria bacterium]|nr:hypothetical protein [Candidatus Paceibacterota bacterium]MBP9842380.1 hypothetical protein [Candidatus Paceibacterota bacterium]
MRELPQDKYGGFLAVTRGTLLFLIVGTLLFSLLLIPFFKARADIVTVFPAMHSVTGSPVEGLENSVQYELIWNNFSNAVPVDVEIHHTLLKLSWSFSEEPLQVNPETVTEVLQSETLPENTQENLEQDYHEIPTPEPVVEETPIVPEVIDTTETTAPAEIQPEPEENVIEAVSMGEIYPLAVASVDEVLPQEPIAVEALSETMEEDIVESQLPEELVEGVSEVVLQDGSLFEVLYSLDGQQWENLGFGNFITPGELTFLLQQFSPEEMVSLQIMIRYTRSPEDARKIYFDNVRLEFDYKGLTEEEILQQEGSGPVDQVPNFSISSVKADVETGNIRAVLLEKGGMLELWYGVINPGATDATWSRLVNDGSIDVDSPIGISGETIFWLDKNQQTLFGFDVKRKSLSGTSFVSDEERDSFLQFQKSNSVMWNARFDASTNSFEFTKDSKSQ